MIRAKQIKAERVGRQTQRPSKGPGAAGEEGGNRKNTKQSTPVPRAASAGIGERDCYLKKVEQGGDMIYIEMVKEQWELAEGFI